MNTLPGISSIHYFDCAAIQPHVMQQALTGAVIDLAVDTTRINFFGTPKCQWEATTANQGRQAKCTLEFSTADTLPEGSRLAFVVTAKSGRQLMIGSREPKYPVIDYTDTTGAPDGEAAVRTYKITHNALLTPVPCVL